jgi:CubicO group peptidase (beta-lactamase class C family)
MIRATGAAIMLAILSGTSCAGAPAQSPGPGAATALTSSDLEAWLGGYMPYALKRGGIPGAAVVVVKGGTVLFEKGYGLADVAAVKPFNPKTTLVRVGSISKLFTWTAVMQLVAAGKLNLDSNVNNYLDFKIPKRHGKAVTLRNLMTHSAGFEEFVRGIAVVRAGDLVPLGDALRRGIPARVYDPGTTPGYSNYGAALAGYIVERVSHERYEDYVARHILTPLRMDHSTMQQPLPASMRPFMAKGYIDSNSPAAEFELVQWRPAGALTTTADDMAQFMIAHLQDGRYGTTQILDAHTAWLMHTSALSILQPLNRMLLGFYEENINGRTVIGHSGDTVYFHAALSLFLHEDVGIFVVFNSPGRDSATATIEESLFNSFSDRYLPGVNPSPEVPDTQARRDAELFQGTYSSSRRSFSNYFAATDLLNQVTVTSNSDATISVSGLVDASGAPRKYREMTPLVWREIDGHDQLAVKIAEGTVVRFGDDNNAPSLVWDHIPWWKSASVLFPAFLGILAVLSLTLVSWPWITAVRWYYARSRHVEASSVLSLRLVRFSLLLVFAAIGGWLWILSILAMPTGIFLLPKYDVQVVAIQCLSILAALSSLLASGYFVWCAWAVNRNWPIKIWSVMVLASIVLLVWIMWIENLLRVGTAF